MKHIKNVALVCAAGTLFMSGCGETTNNADGEPSRKEQSPISIYKLAEIKNVLPRHIRYGDRVNEAGPQNYKAEFDVLVYFGFDKDMKLISSIQYFTASGEENLKPDEEYESIKSAMIKCVKNLDNATTAPLPSCSNALAVSNFDELTFRAPSNIVLASRHASLKFGSEPLVISDRTLRGGVRAMPNKSFYDAHVYKNAFDGRDLVYLRNYYTKRSGADQNAGGIGDTAIDNTREEYWYGMNLFLTVDQANSLIPLPIVIDPDGGNNGGKPILTP